VLLLSVGAPSAARAQNAPPFDPAIDVQLFEYAIGPKTFFAVADADVAAPKQLSMDAMVTFLTNPFTVYNVDASEDMITTERTKVVESLLAAELGAAYGVSDTLQVGAALPVVLSMSGQGLDPETAMPAAEPLAVSGLGDLRLEAKYRLWRSGGIAGAVAGGFTVPTSVGSGGGEFIGDDLPTLRGRLAVQWTSDDGRLSAGGNVGVIVRKPREIYASTVGQQLTWGVAGAVRVTDRFGLVAETFGRTGLSFDVDASPMEVEGGLRVLVTNALAVVVGGGGGVVRGIGSPDLRAFVSIGWAPDTRDSDGDGVNNANDRCPLLPEDKDGWQDGDGCPDDDNDGDRREDAIDRCPDKPEDLDGFEDDDGCPELDNDGDGIADAEDKCALFPEDGKAPREKDGCPFDKSDADGDGVMDSADACVSEAEDLDGFEDWDGCPDPDQDKDGVADADDKCPLCAEDKDGVADADGCPDIDADHDGVLDAQDKCPGEAEVVNGIDDFDGCGDSGGAELVRLDGDRVILDRAPGFDGKGLNRAGQVILDQAALVLMQHPEVTKWTVAVAAPKKRDADKQAAWVRERLIQRGVPAGALQVLASAGDAQVGIVARERAEGDAAPACPAGTEVQPRPQPAAPPAAPASTP